MKKVTPSIISKIYLIMKTKYLANFEEDKIFHIYNRTNNRELLFLSDANRYYFCIYMGNIYHPLSIPFVGV